MDHQKRRETVRRAYDFRCGYCGVREEEVGSELEIDHFQPRACGGSDELDNLVYCCPACNRIKGDFWPLPDPATTPHRLLHPRHDKLTLHLEEGPDGRLIALTETGAFHIERLRLNRPPLVALRQARQATAQMRLDLMAARRERTQLRERIATLESELVEVLAQIAQFLGERE
jgi:hypothetical protein